MIGVKRLRDCNPITKILDDLAAQVQTVADRAVPTANRLAKVIKAGGPADEWWMTSVLETNETNETNGSWWHLHGAITMITRSSSVAHKAGEYCLTCLTNQPQQSPTCTVERGSAFPLPRRRVSRLMDTQAR